MQDYREGPISCYESAKDMSVQHAHMMTRKNTFMLRTEHGMGWEEVKDGDGQRWTAMGGDGRRWTVMDGDGL